MPYFYDVSRAFTSNGSAGTESCHLWGKTAANQETASVSGVYVASRFGTAGGGQLRIKSNSGTATSGGTATTPTPRNIRGNVAAQSVYAHDGTAITTGGTYLVRATVGFAQTGGMGGWVATEPQAKIQMMPNTISPVDVSFYTVCNAASVTGDLTVEFGEGI